MSWSLVESVEGLTLGRRYSWLSENVPPQMHFSSLLSSTLDASN